MEGTGWVGAESRAGSAVGNQISADAEMGALREEYQQRLSGAERKVSAGTCARMPAGQC